MMTSMFKSLTTSGSNISINTILVGLSFLCLYSTFNAITGTCELVLSSYRKLHPRPVFGAPGSGYTSLILFNSFFTLGPFLAPFIVRVLLEKVSLVIAGCTFILYAMAFLEPRYYTVYCATSASGLCTSLLWVAGFNLIAISCENDEHIELNTTVFWLLAQFSYLSGNGVLFFTFYHIEVISDSTRYLTVSILTFFATVGVVLLLFTKEPPPPAAATAIADTSPQNLFHGHHRCQERVQIGVAAAIRTLKETKSLLVDIRTILFSVVFLFTGYLVSFYIAIYPTCLGNTLYFEEDAKWLAGVSGIFIGIGQITACLLRITLNHHFFFFKKGCVVGSRSVEGNLLYVFVGFTCLCLAFVLIFLNIPDDATVGQTENVSIGMAPNKVIAIFSTFLLGFSDCFYETEIFNFIATRLKHSAPSAMAMFSLFQAIGGIIAFSLANRLTLRNQLMIMVISNLAVLAVFSLNLSFTTQSSLCLPPPPPTTSDVEKEDSRLVAMNNTQHHGPQQKQHDVVDFEKNDGDDDDVVVIEVKKQSAMPSLHSQFNV